MTKNIVFDMGKVLLAYEPQKFLKKLFSEEDVIETLSRELFGGPEWPLTDTDALDDEALIFSVTMRIPQYAEQIEKAVEVWPVLMDQADGMEDLLRELKGAGYRLYLLSNAPSKFRNYLGEYPIFSLLDGGIFSGTEQIVKPTAELYRRLCKKYDLVPEECLFVDDRPENIAMARRLGWKGHIFTNCEEFRRWLGEEGIFPVK